MRYPELIKLQPEHIANVVARFTASNITEFAYQVRIRLIFQLINDIKFSRVLQKLLKYFNGTIFLRSFVPSGSVSPVTFCLNLIEALLPRKSSIVPATVKVGSNL